MLRIFGREAALATVAAEGLKLSAQDATTMTKRVVQGHLDSPAPRGRLRSRRINKWLLNAYGRAAGQGDLARTGAKLERVLRWAHRKRGANQGLTSDTANKAQSVRAKRYRDTCAEEFHFHKVRVVSVSQDASRMSGKDTLYCAFYDPARDIACWGDPMAPPPTLQT